jgi:hypothetical protein
MFAVLRTEREWPWTDEALGWTGLLIVAGALVLLTLWTYAGTRKLGWSRLAAVLLLRLAALAIAVLLLVRPFYAQEQEMFNDGQLVLVLDYSSSMRISDGPNSQSRWDTLVQLLEWPEVKEAFARLEREKNIKIHRYQGAEDVRPFDPKSEPDGKRTDIGYWLHALYQKHKNDRNLRGLLVFSDGQNNGTRYSAMNVANEWRGLRCPIYCYGLGNPATKKGQKDIAVVDVEAPQLVFVKTPVKIKATVDAPQLEGQEVTVHLLVEGKKVGTKTVTLKNTRGNKIDVGEFYPDNVGEVKVTVKIDPVPGEFTTLNNEMSTFVAVTKKGISVLWIEGSKRLETTWIIRNVLNRDARFNVIFDERLTDDPLTPAQKALVDPTGKAYDVIVIGGISGSRFAGGDKTVFARLKQHVANKTGLLVLGGFNKLHEDQAPTATEELADILPVDLVKEIGEIDEEVWARPVEAKSKYGFLDIGGPKAWEDEKIFGPLKGLPKLGPARANAQLLLEGQHKEPVMALTEKAGRIVALAADTTHKSWYGNPEAIKAYEQFWRSLFVWLARQEDRDTQLELDLDKRRLSASSNERLGFTVRLFDKKGRAVTNAVYAVKVIAPDGEVTAVKTNLTDSLERGKIGPVSVVGEFKVEVTATGVDVDGNSVKAGPVTARFEAIAEDAENQRPAANHKFLEDVAGAGGGAFRIATKDELLQLLNDLRDKTAAPGWVQTDVWPNWKAGPATDSPFDQLGALWHSGALVCFMLFGLLICTEWFLRRWWGLV